jgi:riboflavin kinase/FMN adenylyltransferase
MELVRDCFSLHKAFPNSALTIGVFDGVHVGHQRIIEAAVKAARAAGAKAVVFTFDPHPEVVLHPDRAPGRILTLQRKLSLLAAAGVDVAICPAESPAVLEMPPEEFVRRIIAEGLGAAVLVEGSNFIFGCGGRGNDALLRELGPQLGFRLEVVPAVTLGGAEVSSTRIRQAVREGRVSEARAMLGRPFEFVGQVVHGQHRGRALGFPTINLEGRDFLMPAEGVYAGRAVLPEGIFGAAISVGRASTFEKLPKPVVEAYLLDFENDLYDCTVELEFLERLRGQQAFPSAAELSRQMAGDCDAVRAVLART